MVENPPWMKAGSRYSLQSSKNPLSASGQAPVASKSVGAFSARVALRAVAGEETACCLAGSALRAEWNVVNRSAVSKLCIASRIKLALPKFVDALLGICFFLLGNSLVCAGAVWMLWLWGVISSFGGGEGWVGRPQRVLVDMFRPRECLVLATYVVFR